MTKSMLSIRNIYELDFCYVFCFDLVPKQQF